MSNVRAPAAYPVCSDNMTAEQASSILPPERNENGVSSSSTKQPLAVPKATSQATKAPARAKHDNTYDWIQRDFRANTLRSAPYTGPIAPGHQRGYQPGDGAQLGVQVGGAKAPWKKRMSGRETATPGPR